MWSRSEVGEKSKWGRREIETYSKCNQSVMGVSQNEVVESKPKYFLNGTRSNIGASDIETILIEIVSQSTRVVEERWTNNVDVPYFGIIISFTGDAGIYYTHNLGFAVVHGNLDIVIRKT